jgi:hypothetical protein
MVRARLDAKTAVERLSHTWVVQRIQRVLDDHPALTMEGWDELSGPSRYTPTKFAKLRRELVGEQGFAQIIAILVSLAFGEIPRCASANWVVHQAKEISGARVSLGAAIAAAAVLGYEPLRDTVGPGCGFGRRAVT